MKYNKKLFKHGGSLAMVIPAEFADQLATNEVTLELQVDENCTPSLIIKPKDPLDAIEDDPKFALFIEAIYQDALENPHKLHDPEDVWCENIEELIKGVDISEDQ